MLRSLILGIIIALPAATPDEFKNDAAFVFGDFQKCVSDLLWHPSLCSLTRSFVVTTWPNGFAFVLSFLAPLWAIGGCFSS